MLVQEIVQVTVAIHVRQPVPLLVQMLAQVHVLTRVQVTV